MLCLEIHLKSHNLNPEDIEKVLQLMGAQAVIFIDPQQQPIFESSPRQIRLWEKTKIKGLFQDKSSADAAWSFLKALFPEKMTISCKTHTEQDWIQAYKNHFQAKCFGGKLWIYPSWSVPPTNKGIHVCLDPGLAFGTGMHASTALCLQWLAKHRLKGETMIDYGCGSGILAITAVKLGAKSVWAIDNDPQALEVTRNNALKNQINSRQLKPLSPAQCPKIKADLIVSNILSKTLIQLAPSFAEHLKIGGVIILSGILAHQVNEITQCFKKWFSLDVVEQDNDWVMMKGRRIP